MRLRLKEDPREWRKFCWTLSLVLVLVAALLVWRQQLPEWVAVVYGVLGCILAVLGWWCPVRFRRTYRVAMTGAHHMGQFMGRVLLLLIYGAVLVPLGMGLRLAGRDLLQMKERELPKVGDSYWRPARSPGSLERLF